MLYGERVTLRAMSREDLRRQWEFNNDLAFELAGGGDIPEPQSYERLEAEFDEEVGKGGRNGTNFAIEADGTYLGRCGLFNVDQVARTAELGIGIGDPAYRGKGYGKEALRLLLDYGFRVCNFRRIWLTVNGDNERAIGAYRAVGFQEEGRQREHTWSNGNYVDMVYMGLPRDDWSG